MSSGNGAATETLDAVAFFEEPRLRSAGRQLAHAVAALHQAGKLHRDLKPSNVLVTGDGVVKVLDFGLIAELEQDERKSANNVGTPAYAPPEQFTGGEPVPASDWYCFGAMLYEALTGRLPFSGSDVAKLVVDKMLSPPKRASQLAAVPDDLDELVAQLLHKEPEERASAEEVLRVLAQDGDDSPLATDLPQAELFVGRSQELERLAEEWKRTASGSPRVTILRAQSGLGKSALLRAFARRTKTEDPNTVVLAGRCYENESLPFKTLDALIDELARFLCALSDAAARELLPVNVHALVDLLASSPGRRGAAGGLWASRLSAARRCHRR
jgi:serine/threonine protein kinase